MIEIGIKHVFLCIFICKLKYIKMPRILQLRQRIVAMSAPRFFLIFGRIFRGRLIVLLLLSLIIIISIIIAIVIVIVVVKVVVNAS